MKQITDWTRDRLSKSFSLSVRKNFSIAVSARDAQETKPQHKIMAFCESPFLFLFREPVAQLVECRVVMREVVSSTPAGPTLRVLK